MCNAYLDEALKPIVAVWSQFPACWECGGVKATHLRYADTVYLIAASVAHLQGMLDSLIWAVNDVGLETLRVDVQKGR